MSQIDELRQIIVGDNTEQLSELKKRIESVEARTRDVAEVLPPAIERGIEESDQLINAFKKPVSETLKRAIRTEPKEYAEILYPVMAPSIRRAISQAISSLLVTINQVTESATSIKGLGMRFESIRTGIPYAEIALRRSILYRIDHVYLIDRETGMLISETASNDAESLDSDAVSAMFSAIQSFVQDSFSQNDQDRLTDLKVGEHNVWVAHGQKVMLACVIYGDAPESLKEHLYDTLDFINTEYAVPLSESSPDPAELAGIDNHLSPLLQLRLKETEPEHNEMGLGQKMMLLALCVIGAYLFYQWFDSKSQLDTAEFHLKQTPGLVVTSTSWDGDKIVVQGLKDPDVVLPYEKLKAYGIEPEEIQLRTTPFRSLEPEMEEFRFRNELNFPDDVTLINTEGKLSLTGETSISWLIKHDSRLRQLSADKRLDISGLRASKESVTSYVSAKLGSSNSPIAKRLIDLFVSKPWSDVSLGSNLPAL